MAARQTAVSGASDIGAAMGAERDDSGEKALAQVAPAVSWRAAVHVRSPKAALRGTSKKRRRA